MIGFAAPDVTAWFTAFEITSYLDAVTAVALAASTMRLKTVRRLSIAVFVSSFRRPIVSGARPRYTRDKTTVTPANDDEDGAAFALAI